MLSIPMHIILSVAGQLAILSVARQLAQRMRPPCWPFQPLPREISVQALLRHGELSVQAAVLVCRVGEQR